MRAQTFTRYYNGEWRRTPITAPRIVPPTKLRRPRSFFGRALPDGTELITQKVWLETRGNGKIYALYAPIYIGSDDLRVVKLDKRDFILESDNSRGAAHYIVQSANEHNPEIAEWLQDYESDRSDGESKFTESVKRFAREFAINVGEPTDANQHARIARAIESHLRSSEFEYTLRPQRVPSDRDWVDYFLFESKRGHCEYFASSMKFRNNGSLLPGGRKLSGMSVRKRNLLSRTPEPNASSARKTAAKTAGDRLGKPHNRRTRCTAAAVSVSSS